MISASTLQTGQAVEICKPLAVKLSPWLWQLGRHNRWQFIKKVPCPAIWPISVVAAYRAPQPSILVLKHIVAASLVHCSNCEGGLVCDYRNDVRAK